MTTNVESLDVVIIGAGAAGLTAGYDLHYYDSPKYSYKILEATSGLGGRLQKLTNFTDFPIDIGGEWIHVKPRVLNRIFDDPDYEEQPTSAIDTVAYLDTYDEYDDNEWKTKPFGSDDYKFVNYTWYDFFNEWMSPDLNIEYGCQVTTIDTTSTASSPVHLTCKDGRQYTAQHVILTASIGVLQNEDIQFVPDLPNKVWKAIDTFWMMSGLKVFMRFEAGFYKEAFEFATDYENVEIGSRYFYSATYGQDTDDHVLGVFQVGDPAERFLTMTDEQIYEDVLQQLDEVYNGQATPNFIEGFVQNWNQQPYVKGAYTHLTDDSDDLQAVDTLRKPVFDGKIFFAGEAIPPNNYQYGFAHEASFSGRAAAAKIIDLLNNNKNDNPGVENGPNVVSSTTTNDNGDDGSSEPSSAIHTSRNHHWVVSASVLLALLLRKIW